MYYTSNIKLIENCGGQMDIHLDCLPCFLRQVLEASRISTEDDCIQRAVMKEAVKLLADVDTYKYSPQFGRALHFIVKEITGKNDPYSDIKKDNIRASLELYPHVKQYLFRNDSKRLYWALKASATGNVMDSAIYKNVDITACFFDELEKEFAVSHLERFEELLKKSRTLLIIGDNAGETVFDRVLIEEILYMKIIYGVRNSAIINDATLEDAIASGLGSCSTIMPTGCDAPGLIIEEATDEFKKVFFDSDIVISKGQGNFETLSGQNREIFFLLKAKCPIVADRIGVEVGDHVFFSNSRNINNY